MPFFRRYPIKGSKPESLEMIWKKAFLSADASSPMAKAIWKSSALDPDPEIWMYSALLPQSLKSACEFYRNLCLILAKENKDLEGMTIKERQARGLNIFIVD